jgi:hypothetical protein
MAAQRLHFRNNLSSWLKVSLVVCGVLQLAAAIFAFQLRNQLSEFALSISPLAYYDAIESADNLESAETAANIATVAVVIVLLIWLNRAYRAWGRPKLRVTGVLSIISIALAVGFRVLAHQRESRANELSFLIFEPMIPLNLIHESVTFEGIGLLLGVLSTGLVFLYIRQTSSKNWI